MDKTLSSPITVLFDVELVYNIVLITAVQKSDSDINPFLCHLQVLCGLATRSPTQPTCWVLQAVPSAPALSSTEGSLANQERNSLKR